MRTGHGPPARIDVDAALDRALQVVWAKGYESRSMDDLCQATGLGRPRLHAAFGDKRALYLRALERGAAAAAQRIGEALARPLPVREAVTAFLGRLIDDIVAGPRQRGCLIGNSRGRARARRDPRRCGRHRPRAVPRVRDLAVRPRERRTSSSHMPSVGVRNTTSESAGLTNQKPLAISAASSPGSQTTTPA